MTKAKHDTRLCPEGCRIRNKAVPFCGYCLHRILKEREDEKNADRETEAEHTE